MRSDESRCSAFTSNQWQYKIIRSSYNCKRIYNYKRIDQLYFQTYYKRYNYNITISSTCTFIYIIYIYLYIYNNNVVILKCQYKASSSLNTERPHPPALSLNIHPLIIHTKPYKQTHASTRKAQPIVACLCDKPTNHQRTRTFGNQPIASVREKLQEVSNVECAATIQGL